MKRDAADAAFSLAVRKRDNWTCRRCHKAYPEKSQGLHAAHIFSRSIKRTRHDMDNGLSCCYGCHSWGHRNPLEFHEWARKEIGPRKYDALKLRASRLDGK